MDATKTLALAKLVAEKAAKQARAQVVPGSYPVDLTVRVRGELTVAEDGEKTSTSSLISEDALILAPHFSGCTRERAVEVLSNVVAAALAGWTGSDADKAAAKAAHEALVAEYDADGRVRQVLAQAKATLPKTRVSGSVKFCGCLDEVAAE